MGELWTTARKRCHRAHGEGARWIRGNHVQQGESANTELPTPHPARSLPKAAAPSPTVAPFPVPQQRAHPQAVDFASQFSPLSRPSVLPSFSPVAHGQATPAKLHLFLSPHLSRTHRCSDTLVSSYHSKGKTQFFGRKRTGLGGFFFLSLCPLAIVGCGLLGSMCGVYEPKGDLGTHLGVTPRVPRPLSDLSSSLHLSEACSV